MYTGLFYDFLLSQDNLQVYEKGEALFTSDKDRLLPWLEYIDMFSPYVRKTIAFEKVLGNAAALLAMVAGCRVIYCATGSRLAVATLDKYQVKYKIMHIVPFIQRKDSQEMCPLEKLSLGKDPDEYYELIRDQLLLSLKGM